MRVPRAPLSRHKAWHWLRGVFGASGFLALPRTGYSLALRIRDEGDASVLARILARLALPFKRRAIAGTQEFMLRSQEDIVSFLSRLGLHGVSLRLEERAIVRSMKDQANKRVNCDAANIRKSVAVAAAQVEFARELKASGRCEALQPLLREMIDLRLRYPEATLTELGTLFSSPVSKSTVKYRWNKIVSFDFETR
jgi:DNA-binding protein WhiA